VTVHFTIPEFWLGVLSLLSAEILIVIVAVVRYNRKQKREGQEGDKPCE
jgi:hypothetical protein